MEKLTRKNNIKFAKSEGYSFFIDDEVWHLDKETQINTSRVKKLMNHNQLYGFLNTLAFFAENYSGKYVFNLFYRMKSFLEFKSNKKEFTEEDLINYKSSLTSLDIWHMSLIRIFFNKWNGLGYPGVSKEITHLLSGWRFKGNLKGDIIKRKDPNQGPLTDNELLAFNDGVVQAYERQLINKKELVLSLLISHTGRRPIQISHLKIKDIVSSLNKKGEPVYFINIPRAKQSGEFRGEFKLFALKEEIWNLTKSLAKDIAEIFVSKINFEVDKKVYDSIPLFPDWNSLSNIDNNEKLQYLLETDKLHIKNARINRLLNQIIRKANVHSERTGKIIQISPRRFRYTIGTRAAREGFGELIIAELLDHSDTQNAGVYVKNVPEHVTKIDEAVGFQLAPFAQAFVGKLVDKESDSVRGNDKSSRIRNDNGKPVGNCGDYGFCGANVPIPCYTCIHFQPWVDGPHKEVYENLLEERKRIEKFTGDIAITEILDRSIMAVAEVVQKCEKRKSDNITSKKALK